MVRGDRRCNIGDIIHLETNSQDLNIISMVNKHLVLLREEKLELVGVSVAIELASDRVGVAGDDGVEVRTPNPHTVYMARRDVTQDVNLWTG